MPEPQCIYTGFILSAQAVKTDGGVQYVFWLHSEAGPLKVVTEPQRLVFFIPERVKLQAVRILEQVGCKTSVKDSTLKDFDGGAVLACYFLSLSDYYRGRESLENAGLRCFEGDIRPVERYLMERFIRGGVWVHGRAEQRTTHIEITHARLKANPDVSCNFNIVSLDIECSGQGVLFSVGLVAAGSKKVLMVGSPQSGAEPWIEWVTDESALLLRLCELFAELDPDLVIGWNVINFDFRLLYERAEALGIKLSLGRDGERVQFRDSKVSPLLLPGRAVLDGIDMLKNATYQFHRFSLANVAAEVLGEEKLISGGNRLEEIERQFREDKQALARYNLVDCQLVMAIFEKLKLTEFARIRTQLTGLALERLGGSVASFTNLYLPLLHRSGYVAPDSGDHGLTFESPGGYVMDSTPGLYRNVLVLDFKSLYPSIMRTFHVDPLGLVEGLLAPGSAIPGFNGACFSREHHHLPRLIAELAAARQGAKDQGDSMLSQAIKIIMNSLYGVLGSRGCRFFDPRLASSITLRGHEIMKTTRQWIEQLGYPVIYGDTDSTFVALPGDLDAIRCNEIGEELAGLINRQWRDELKREYGIESFLELEFETLYSPFFMPTIRGQEVGSKKRYVGRVCERGEYRNVFKGMETVRSDWTDFAREFQQALYTALFAGDNVEQIVEEFVKRLFSGDYDAALVYRKRLGKRPEDYNKTIPPHVRAVINAGPQVKQHEFAKGDWVYYVITRDGPKLLREGLIPDHEHYLEKQIRPIADDLLNYLKVSFEQITSSQQQLF